MTDPIADMLTRIRNASASKRPTVSMPYSKMKQAILSILKEEGYVASTEVSGDMPKTLTVTLKYDNRIPAIQSLVRESKPGHRMYRAADELPRVMNDIGMAVISTPQGMMTNKKARKLGIGGEVICSVY